MNAVIESYENSREEERLTTDRGRRVEFLTTMRILREWIEQKKLRINTLNDMQKHFSGFYDSVKAVMNACEHRILKGIHGPVSSVIRTEEKYSVAIETE